MKSRRAAQALGALLVLSGSACSQILEIEEAHVDATLLPGQSAGASSGSSHGVEPPPAGESGGGTASAGSHNHVQGGASDPGGGSSSAGSLVNEGGAPAPSELDLCERYCDQVMSACKDKYEQYRTFDQCVQVCKRLPAGKPGDEDANSVTCRLRQAEFADSEPFVYCKSAGPLGAGKCGSNCVSYCSLMQVECTPVTTAGNLEPSYFASSQECLAVCGDLPTLPGGPGQYSSSALAEPSSFVGNSVFCRTYHVAAALEQDTPDEHCPHAMGGDPCIDP